MRVRITLGTLAHESYRNDNKRDTELAVTIVESNYKE